MPKSFKLSGLDGVMLVVLGSLLSLSIIVLNSITPSIYPNYYIFIILGLVTIYVFLNIDFEILTAFSAILYFFSILFLIMPLLIGQVTRGAIRWIQIGSLTIQPSEVVRPFLLLYFAKYITEEKLTNKRLLRLFIIVALPVFLILVQPSLGVSILTSIGFVGVLMASSVDKKYMALGIGAVVFSLPLIWFLLAPYQQQRVRVFLDPFSDPKGAGYNSIQSMIAVGSGRLFGRGLGEGVQTQLQFLPEKHTDFIFAAIAEELGMMGSMLVIIGLFSLFWVLSIIIEKAKNHTARAFVSGVFLVLLAESMIHIGMNMGLVPITGVPLPFISAGGSALIGTTISITMAMNAKKA